MASKEPINDENDDCFITIFVIHGSVKMQESGRIVELREYHCEDEE